MSLRGRIIAGFAPVILIKATDWWEGAIRIEWGVHEGNRRFIAKQNMMEGLVRSALEIFEAE